MSGAPRKPRTKTPKTPTRGRKDNREPLTPSLNSALGALSISNLNLSGDVNNSSSASASKLALQADPDASINPFLETSVPLGQSLKAAAIFGTSNGVPRAPGSRPTSRPGSRAGSRPSSRAGSPKRSKSAHGPKNTVNLYGMETKLDIIEISEWPPNAKKDKDTPTNPTPRKRAKSQTSARPRSGDYGDRFYMNRNPNANILAQSPPQIGSQENSPAHIARLASAANIEPDGRILTFHEAPPVSAADPMLAAQKAHMQSLYAQNKSGSTGGSSTSSSATAKVRRLPTQPERVLDAPGILDDFYLHLLAWSSRNELAVGLEDNTYIWRASTGAASHLAECGEGKWVTSLDWSADGAFLAIGLSNGDIELWDPEAEKKLRTMTGHDVQVGVLSWNNHILSSGCQDGSIWHHDVRVARHHQATLRGHVGEVCGLKWRPDGLLLASGGNDNVVNIWDGRYGEGDTEGTVGAVWEQRTAKWTKRNHTAAVKALAWCPWQDSLLATGGGTGDATVHFWNTNTGGRTASLTTPAQVTSIHFTPLAKEVMTTHGYPTNSVMVHSYPSLTKIGEIKDAHDSRVLYSAISPVGDTVVTGAGDENVKFWKLWEVPAKKGKGSGKSGSDRNILTLR